MATGTIGYQGTAAAAGPTKRARSSRKTSMSFRCGWNWGALLMAGPTKATPPVMISEDVIDNRKS